LRGTLSVWYSGVGSAYHLSQAIADGKLGEDKPFTAVIVEARDFCNFFGPYFIFVSDLINVGKQAQAQQVRSLNRKELK